MSDEKIVQVAMAGCGTVGSGIAEIIMDRGDELAARTGLRFELSRVLVSDIRKERYISLDPSLLTADAAEFSSAEADMTVEVIGGVTTAREVVMSSLRAGRPVVTANKALLALHGVEVFRTAHEHDTCIAFEASCAGGLPIVGAVLRGLPANRIDRLVGIFNSTCNYILTEMLASGVSYDDAIKEAKRLGYAEADPTLDVSGMDTAHKLTILASLAFGKNLDFNRVVVNGIDKLRLGDLRAADEMGYTIKLLGDARRVYEDDNAENEGGRPDEPSSTVALQVQPMLVPKSHPMARMRGTSSGILVDGDAVGETFYGGSGAGSLPTASGVVADMIDVATGSAHCTFRQLRIFNDQTPTAHYVAPDEMANAFFVRLDIDPAFAAPQEAQRAWQDSPVPLRVVRAIDRNQSIAVVTEPMTEKRFRAALQYLAASLHPVGQPVVLRVFTG